MGYMRHHGMLVTSWDTGVFVVAHAKAKALRLITSAAMESAVNGYVSFAVFPDGSKEGLEDSDKGDVARAEFIAWLETQRYEDGSSSLKWVEVQYGDDEHDTRVITHSEANQP